MQEEIVVPLAGMLMIVVLAIGIPLVRAMGRRWENEARQPRSDPEAMQRLARIEQAIDAMALEVERISEGQRFVTRLMSDKAPERVALPQESGQRRQGA
ncbi:MAG: hypothetical protein ACREOG_14485 [Gemmatimonadaceae bacterium]